MKITAFFLFFFIIISCAFGQKYQPMLTEGSTWHEYFTVWPEGNATLHIGGDSIVNGVTYKKIFADPAYGAILDEGYFRLLREDTLEKKIYELWWPTEPEDLLYDFTLAPGDTFHIRVDTEEFIVLDSISDTIINPYYCNGNNMPEFTIEKPRVFYFKGASYPIIWVEGIGSLTGLLTSYEWGGGIRSYLIMSL